MAELRGLEAEHSRQVAVLDELVRRSGGAGSPTVDNMHPASPNIQNDNVHHTTRIRRVSVSKVMDVLGHDVRGTYRIILAQ